MPDSKLSYYDIGSSNFTDVRETSSDSQRVGYEDPTEEIRLLRDSVTEENSMNHIVGEQRIIPDINSATIDSSFPESPLSMEGIQKYSGVGGGSTQKSFKQDA